MSMSFPLRMMYSWWSSVFYDWYRAACSVQTAVSLVVSCHMQPARLMFYCRLMKWYFKIFGCHSGWFLEIGVESLPSARGQFCIMPTSWQSFYSLPDTYSSVEKIFIKFEWFLSVRVALGHLQTHFLMKTLDKPICDASVLSIMRLT